MGLNRMADALTATASSYSMDNDPEFVRLAAPSTLKLVEMLLGEQPTHQGLLLTACSGFTQYAFGFLHIDAEIAQISDQDLAAELRGRAMRMYERARDYCVRALEARHRGFRDQLGREPQTALALAEASDVAALFWLGVSWGGELSLAENQLVRLPELAAVRAILDRALALDETWERGAIHEAFIALEGLSRLLGGSADRAKRHFDRAVELSAGQSAFAYVAMATSVARPARDRAGFERWLKAALAIDVNRVPALRLANLIAQKRARFLMSRASELIPGR